MSENPMLRGHLMSLAELFDEPQHLNGPDALRCSASGHPEAWMELTTGWSRVLQAARILQSRHESDSRDDVLGMCADAAREAATGELRWVWARLVNKFIQGMSADV